MGGGGCFVCRGGRLYHPETLAFSLAVRYICPLSSHKGSMRATCDLQFSRNPMLILANSVTLGSFRGSFSLNKPFRNLRSLCYEAETSALLRHYATSAFVFASISFIRSISSTRNLRSLCAIAKLGGRSHHRGNLGSLCASLRPPKPFSPPRNLSAFSANCETDGFLRP